MTLSTSIFVYGGGSSPYYGESNCTGSDPSYLNSFTLNEFTGNGSGVAYSAGNVNFKGYGTGSAESCGLKDSSGHSSGYEDYFKQKEQE